MTFLAQITTTLCRRRAPDLDHGWLLLGLTRVNNSDNSTMTTQKYGGTQFSGTIDSFHLFRRQFNRHFKHFLVDC